MAGVTQKIYVSRAVARVDRAELVAIAAESGERNAARDVTGTLLYCEGYFVQMLEGDDAVLTPLLARIAADPRHCDLQILFSRAAGRRLFPEWRMSCLHEEAMTDAQRGLVAELLGHLDRTGPGAPAWGSAARELMEELRGHIAAVAAQAA